MHRDAALRGAVLHGAAWAISVAMLGAIPSGDLHAQSRSCRVVGAVAPLPTLREASGAALGRRTQGVIWTHNDSGEPVITALDTTGAVQARMWVAAARLVDWEDIAVGPCPTGSCVYVADIGDNAAKRSDITVYRFTEPALRDQSTRDAEVFRGVYPARAAQDAEALFVTPDGAVYVVTKGESAAIGLYRFPMPLRTGLPMQLEKVATLSAAKVPRPQRVTGAAISPDGKWVVLRRLTSLAFYRTERLTQGNVARPIVIDVSGARERQGEGVALANDGNVYLLGEGGGKGRPGSFVRLKCELPP